AGRLGARLDEGADVVQRGLAVDVRLADAQQVEVGTVEHIDRFRHAAPAGRGRDSLARRRAPVGLDRLVTSAPWGHKLRAVCVWEPWMKLWVNGEERSIDRAADVAGLVALLG